MVHGVVPESQWLEVTGVNVYECSEYQSRYHILMHVVSDCCLKKASICVTRNAIQTACIGTKKTTLWLVVLIR